MSHAYGEVTQDGKVVAHFEYNGTSNVCCPKMYDTWKAMNAEWRKGPWVKCTCGKPSVDVILYTDYGNGYYWPGKACFECGCITGGLMPWGDDDDSEPIDGHPLQDEYVI